MSNRIASQSVRSDDTVVKGTPWPPHRIPHSPAVGGHSPREDRKLRERFREGPARAPVTETPLEEEHDVDRQVRDYGVARIAPDLEPLRMRWSDQLGRHGCLLSASSLLPGRRRFGVWAIPRKCDFSSAAASVWIQKFCNTVRSTTSISAIAKSAPMHRRGPPPNASQVGATALVPRKRCGSNRSGCGIDLRILVKISDPDEHRAAVRNFHVAEVGARRR